MNSVPFRSSLLVISVLLLVSCGGDASFSPTAPSGSGTAGQTGAVIVGQVNGTSAPATTRSTTSMVASAGTRATGDAASVTVKVLGTNISTTTNGQGQFTLTGVPPGEVRLEFTGAGGSALISISGVRADEEIRITVTLNGTNARVDSERREKRGDSNRQDQSELKGAVSGLTGTCPKLSFTVRGMKVTTSETTQFEHVRCGDIKNGSVVEVKGSRQGDSITATKVESDDEDDDEDEDEDDDRDRNSRISTQAQAKGAVSGLTGTCPKLTFTVQSTKVATSESTRFEDVRCAAIKDGMVLEITGARQSDNSIAATKVERDD